MTSSQRPWSDVSEGSKGWELGRNYVVHRYLLLLLEKSHVRIYRSWIASA